MTSVEKIIKEKGPILSSELIQIIENQNKGISKEAARKRISRVGNDISKIKGLFTDGQILFHDKAIYNSEEYFLGLSQALKKSGKQYHIILQSLDFHFGQIRTEQLPSYSINPVDNLKGHLTFHTALDNLKSLNLLSQDDNYINISPNISDDNSNYKRSKGIEVAKNFLLIQFNDWARKLGLASYNTSSFYSEFGKYQFNYVNPSYLGTLPRYNANKKVVPGFLVADILIGNSVNENQVEFFVNKVKTLKYRRNVAQFLPFLIVESIDTKSLNILKAEGIAIGFVNELFGEKYKDLLNSLIGMVTNAGAILKKNPEAYLDLITNLNKLVDGKTNNLKGDLFELAVGYYQGRKCNSIDIGKLINFEGKQREIDVLGFLPNKIIIAECKGYNHQVSEEEVETWLGEKVPVIRKWLLDQSHLTDRDLCFEFWSTGGFTSGAKTLLEKRKSSMKKYQIDYFEIKDMLQKSKELKSKKFTEILREYYIKDI